VSDDLSSKLAASRAKLEQKKKLQQNGEQSESAIVEAQPVSLSGEKPTLRRGKKSAIVKAVDVQRMPPHSVEAELGVLSSIMLDAQWGSKGFTVLAEVATKITPDYFFVPAHKTIYEGFVRLWRNDITIDLISFTEWLRDHKLLDSIGGAQYVTQLVSFVPTAANVVYYCDVMIDKMRRREAIAAHTLGVRSAYSSMDEDEFLANEQRITNRLLTLVSTNGKFPQMIDVADFTDDVPVELPRLVIHYLLHEGSKMLLGGNSKGRKTWTLLDLALSVATGTDWWGFHTRKGCVCYVNLELQPAFFRQRLDKIKETRSLAPERGAFLAWHLRGYAKPMRDLINDLLVFLQQHRFTLIIIDPIYKTLPATHGAENDSAIITQLLNDIEAIAVETGAAVLFSSHFSKGDQSEKESIDRVSGSGAWARDPDSVITMTPHEDADSFTVDATLRNLAPIRPFVVKWDYPLFTRIEEADPDKLKRPRGKGRPTEYTDDAILTEMRDVPWRAGELQKHVQKETGMTSASFYRLWAVLKKDDKIIATDDNKWQRSEAAAQPF
jgi:AAA domain/DnaB-like helicase N terminal domain